MIFWLRDLLEKVLGMKQSEAVWLLRLPFINGWEGALLHTGFKKVSHLLLLGTEKVPEWPPVSLEIAPQSLFYFPWNKHGRGE